MKRSRCGSGGAKPRSQLPPATIGSRARRRGLSLLISCMLCPLGRAAEAASPSPSLHFEWLGNTGGNGKDNDFLYASSFSPDGSSVVLAGYTYSTPFEGKANAGSTDFVALSLDAKDGSVNWEYQKGSSESDFIYAAAFHPDGDCVALAGFTLESPLEGYTNVGKSDFVAIGLDPKDGSVLWAWQGGSEDFDEIHAISWAPDGKTLLLAGYTSGAPFESHGYANADESYDFVCFALNLEDAKHITVEWAWQGGSDRTDKIEAAAFAPDGKSVILAGSTWGSPFQGYENAGNSDFVAFSVSVSDQKVQWAWQAGSPEADKISGAAMSPDGSALVLAGDTHGDPFGDSKASREGSNKLDFVAAGFDSLDGSVKWSYQRGSPNYDLMRSVSYSPDGKSVVLGGFSLGSPFPEYSGAGEFDFCAIALASLDGSELWTWQRGTKDGDLVQATSWSPSGTSIVLAGISAGHLAAVSLLPPEIEYCSFITCKNGGECVDDACKCATGYEGLLCEKQIDPCSSAVCSEGEECVDGECQPTEGSEETNVTIEGTVEEGVSQNFRCQSNSSCFNGGTCVDGRCECLDGYEGTQCEMDASAAAITAITPGALWWTVAAAAGCFLVHLSA